MKQTLESILYTVNNSVGVHLETDICCAFVLGRLVLGALRRFVPRDWRAAGIWIA